MVRPIKYKSAGDCPDAGKHTPHPPGLIGHHSWMDEKSKTHNQKRCPHY